MANRIGPSTTADANAPTRIAICWNFGVDPTRNPVFKSCDVVPPLEAAMQTIPPIERAVTKYGGAVHPIIRKTRQVSSSVATVIPEIGFDEESISPVSRDETVTNRNPNATIRTAPTMLPRRLSCG